MENSMEAAMKHAENIAKYLNKCGSLYIIQISLKEMSVPSGSQGFQYAKQSIRILCENPTAKLSHGVYLAAGMISDPPADEDQVEQAIRNVIRRAWNERDEQIWSCFFPVGTVGRTECPSNRDFLMAVVDFVELWKGFCEEVNYERK